VVSLLFVLLSTRALLLESESAKSWLHM